MSKQYAHLHAMAKTSVKFQNDWPKTVGGVALTRQLLTNGQTDERTGHSTPISHQRANAGATKTRNLIRVYNPYDASVSIQNIQHLINF